MNITRYFSLGSESEAEGLTFIINVYDQQGNFVAGVPNVDQLYKSKEITETEYLNHLKKLQNNDNKGLFGIVNAEGKKKVDEVNKAIIDNIKAKKNKQQALVAKRLARQLEAGLIDEEDLDTAIEIELPGVPADQISVLKDQISSLRVKHKTM